MDTYLKNLLPRFKQHGKKLNKIEAFVDKAWIVPNIEHGSLSYRFLRNKILLITKNGDVEEGTWDFLEPDSLYLKFGKEKKMFSHGFILEDVLLLQIDSHDTKPFLMYDSKLGTIDIVDHFKKQRLRTENLKPIAKTDYFVSNVGSDGQFQKGQCIYNIDLELIKQDTLVLNSKVLSIKNGIITRVGYKQSIETDSGRLELQTAFLEYISTGDKVVSGSIKDKNIYKIIGHVSYRAIDLKDDIITAVRMPWFHRAVYHWIFLLVTIVLSIVIIVYVN